MNPYETLQFHCPTKIVHGIGSLEDRLGEEAKYLDAGKAIIVTDAGIAEVGLLDNVYKCLKNDGITCRVFDKIEHDAQVAVVDEGAAICREENIDVVVAIGGGSALAAGKAVASIAKNGGSLGDHQGLARVSARSLPLIAIPTTAGSGAEVSAAVPYFDEDRSRKTGTFSQFFFPDVAILDATLLRSLPFRQAGRSGVDALTHAMEAFLTVKATPITDAMALSAIELLSRNLRMATMTHDLEAKQSALIGSTMANLACGNAKLGLAHLLNRPVNSLFPEVPYGESIGILLVPVMEFNLSASIERFGVMAKCMGEEGGELNGREFAAKCLLALKNMLADLRIVRHYSTDSVDRRMVPRMARMAAKGMHGGMKTEDMPDNTVIESFNLRRATIGDVIGIYEQAFEGWVI